MGIDFSITEIPYEIRDNKIYQHPKHSEFESISKTVIEVATMKYWDAYKADILQQVDDLDDDSDNDCDIDALLSELPRPSNPDSSMADIDIKEKDISNFITILIHQNSLWDLGFQLLYKNKIQRLPSMGHF